MKTVANAIRNVCIKFFIFLFRWYEELKVQYESEKVKLKENAESQVKIATELNEKKRELEGRIGQLEKHVK